MSETVEISLVEWPSWDYTTGNLPWLTFLSAQRLLLHLATARLIPPLPLTVSWVFCLLVPIGDSSFLVQWWLVWVRQRNWDAITSSSTIGLLVFLAWSRLVFRLTLMVSCPQLVTYLSRMVSHDFSGAQLLPEPELIMIIVLEGLEASSGSL